MPVLDGALVNVLLDDENAVESGARSVRSLSTAHVRPVTIPSKHWEPGFETHYHAGRIRLLAEECWAKKKLELKPLSWSLCTRSERGRTFHWQIT